MLQSNEYPPRGQQLLARVARRKLIVSFSFAGLALAMQVGYVLLNAFGSQLLAARIAPGSSITVAIALGYLMILATAALTGVYVYVNNRYVAPGIERLRRRYDV